MYRPSHYFFDPNELGVPKKMQMKGPREVDVLRAGMSHFTEQEESPEVDAGGACPRERRDVRASVSRGPPAGERAPCLTLSGAGLSRPGSVH